MNESVSIINSPRNRAKKIFQIIERHKERLGSFEVVPVGEVGFLLQSEREKPVAGNDWVMLDYDDTLVATTKVKQKRFELFRSYIKKNISDIPNSIIKRLLDATDQFSRWEEKPNEGRHYHVGAHMSALTWATDYFKQHADQNPVEIVQKIESQLSEIKQTLSTKEKPGDEAPFYFKNHKLILRSKKPWSPEIEMVFQKTMFNPPLYKETIQAAEQLGSRESSSHRFNLGIFTYGEPAYQLAKVLNLLDQNPALPISQIWLTKCSKGKFIKELVETKAVMKDGQSELESTTGESLSPPSRYPLSQNPHTLFMIDDDPEQLNSILSANPDLKNNSGARFVPVRSRRKATKNEKQEWKTSELREIDFSNQKLSSEKVEELIEINSYLAARRHYAPDHHHLQSLKQGLERKGVDVSQLKEKRD